MNPESTHHSPYGMVSCGSHHVELQRHDSFPFKRRDVSFTRTEDQLLVSLHLAGALHGTSPVLHPDQHHAAPGIVPCRRRSSSSSCPSTRSASRCPWYRSSQVPVIQLFLHPSPAGSNQPLEQWGTWSVFSFPCPLHRVPVDPLTNVHSRHGAVRSALVCFAMSIHLWSHGTVISAVLGISMEKDCYAQPDHHPRDRLSKLSRNSCSPHEVLTPRGLWNYPMSLRAICGTELACDNMATPDCMRTLFFVNAALSREISAS
jgi:hypothetical protein